MRERGLTLILIISALCGVFLISMFKTADYDAWWILAVGRYVIEHMEIPKVDVFRFVSIQTEYKWHNHLYLTGSIFYITYLLGGFKGLVLFKALISTLAFGIYMAAMRQMRQVGAWFPAILTVLAAFAARFRLVERPDLFSILLFVSVYLIVIRLKQGRKTPLFLLPLLFLLWANLHAGYFAGLVLLVTVIITEFLKIGIKKLSGRELSGILEIGVLKGLVLWVGISSLVVVINPFGIEVYQSFFNMMMGHRGIDSGAATARVGEWQPLTFNHFKGLGVCYTSEYGVLLLLFVSTVFIVFRRTDLTYLILVLGFFYASTVSIRFVPYAVIILGPAICKNYEMLQASRLPSNLIRAARGMVIAATMTGIILGCIGATIPPNFKFGLGVKEGRFPEGAVRYIKSNGIDGNFFNTYGIGGFLIWSFYPERRVFMDGRVLDNIGDYYKMIDSPQDWRELEKKYNFDVVVLENDKKDFVAHLYSNPEWALVYWDDRGLVFLKDIPKYRPLIERDRYRFVKPYFYNFDYIEHDIKGDAARMAAIKELQRNIASTELNSEARLALTYLYFGLGKSYYDESIRQVREAIRIAPHIAMAHSALGYLYLLKGEKGKGMAEIREALRLDPTDPLATDLMEKK